MPISLDNDLRSLSATQGDQHAKLKKTTQAFEGVFVGMMLKQMRKSLENGDALFGKSPESKLYQEMADEATAERLSQNGSFGIAKTLYDRLEKLLPPEEKAEKRP